MPSSKGGEEFHDTVPGKGEGSVTNSKQEEGERESDEFLLVNIKQFTFSGCIHDKSLTIVVIISALINARSHRINFDSTRKKKKEKKIEIKQEEKRKNQVGGIVLTHKKNIHFQTLVS